jgi:hypothetical protein
LIVVPRPIWLWFARRSPTLLDHSLLCLIFYSLAASLALLLALPSISVDPADVFLPRTGGFISRIIMLAILSAWLMAPDVFSVTARNGLIPAGRFAGTVASLMVALLLCLGLPFWIEQRLTARVSEKWQAKDLVGLGGVYLRSSLEPPMFGLGMELALASFGFPNVDSFWQAVGRSAGEPLRDRPAGPRVDTFADEFCALQSVLKIHPSEFGTVGFVLDEDSLDSKGYPAYPAIPSGASQCRQWLMAEWSRTVSSEQEAAAMRTRPPDLTLSLALRSGGGSTEKLREDLSGPIERDLGMLIIMKGVTTWSARANCGCIWLWALATASFWATGITSCGDLARKGILAGLLPTLIRSIAGVAGNGFLFIFLGSGDVQLEGALIWALPAVLAPFYVWATGSRRPFASRRWTQVVIITFWCEGTVALWQWLRPPLFLSLSARDWFYAHNLTAALLCVAVLVVSFLQRGRIAGWAAAPVPR